MSFPKNSATHLVMKHVALASLAAILLTACVNTNTSAAVFERPAPRTAAEIEFAKQTLERLQKPSFKTKKEYCGYIKLAPDGTFTTSKPHPGRQASCFVEIDVIKNRAVAHFHTHGSYSPEYESELPSSDDLFHNVGDVTDGYISTPGGRIWLTDAIAGTAELICGEYCVTPDPSYDPGDTPRIKRKYTLKRLKELEARRR